MNGGGKLSERDWIKVRCGVDSTVHCHRQERWTLVSRKDQTMASLGASAISARDLAVIGLDLGDLASV